MNARSWRRFEPVLLLFAAGGFVGLIFPLAKLAGAQGLQPLTYAGLSAAGASLLLLASAHISDQRIVPSKGELRYAAIAGQLTFAIPFGTLAVIIPHSGSGVPAILQSLAPILTLAIVYVLGFERPRLARVAGLGIGLAGVLLILSSRGAQSDARADALPWYLLALITPAALAAGNVYRSASWPTGSQAQPLAGLTLAFAALGLLSLAAILWLTGQVDEPWRELAKGWHLVLVQSFCTGIGYAFFFRLQQVGGPVFLSQISYVNTGVGVAFAVAVFGEKLPITIWFAAACIFSGIALVTLTARPQD